MPRNMYIYQELITMYMEIIHFHSKKNIFQEMTSIFNFLQNARK